MSIVNITNNKLDLSAITPAALNEALIRYLATLSANMDCSPVITMPSWMANRLDNLWGYPHGLNRDKGRKEIRRRNRVNNVSTKVYGLLLKCDISFLSTLSSEEIDRLKQSVNLALNRDGIGVDYYPIPKGLNNKLRKFIHDNPLRPGHASLGAEDSFFII